MDKPTKAVMLSALVFPGTGHFFLKQYLSGTVIVVTASISLYILVSSLIEKAFQISEKIIGGEIQPDIISISTMVSKQITHSEDQSHNIAGLILVVVWIICIFDAYRIARKQSTDLQAST